MKIVLLIDFGSTYTKVSAVDMDKEEVIGNAVSFTTIKTDINQGLENAVKLLEQKTGTLEISEYLACSSAAGGLRMVVSGLVEGVTSYAAKQASLGAGAKVIKVYSYEMTREDIEEIEKIEPEIFLLAGGTDGGDKKCILHNAKMISQCKSDFPIIIAGNKVVSEECRQILMNKEVYIVENVMPKYGELNIEPVQNKIRDIFLSKIIYAKGITKASSLVSGIIMPTPYAMVKAMELLANGYEEEKGIGELLAIDLGGATTDIYSIADGFLKESNVIYKGLREPYVKRTVEGDIGMRYSVHGILEEVEIDDIANTANLNANRTKELIDFLYNNPQTLPNDNLELSKLDFALAANAIEIATIRHAGNMDKIYTSTGISYIQKGKDLRDLKTIVVTGGSIIHLPKVNQVAKYALYSDNKPESLRPIKAQILVDRKYILAAMGLLSESYPKIAIRIMKKELKYDGN